MKRWVIRRIGRDEWLQCYDAGEGIRNQFVRAKRDATTWVLRDGAKMYADLLHRTVGWGLAVERLELEQLA